MNMETKLLRYAALIAQLYSGYTDLWVPTQSMILHGPAFHGLVWLLIHIHNIVK